MMNLETVVTPLKLKEGISHENLTLIPLTGDSERQLDYILATEALKTGNFSVTEIDEGGSVPELLVTNTSDSRVLLLDGEELIGAKQNRILNVTVLVPPQSKLKIPVSCIEQGRWRYASRNFQVGKHAPSSIRAKKSAAVLRNLKTAGVARSDQGEVWDDVDNMIHASKSVSQTSSLSDVYLQKKGAFAHFTEALTYPAGSTGVMAAINGKFVALDVFDKAATLERIWPNLISGYILDAICSKGVEEQEFSLKGAGALLEHVAKLPTEKFPAVGHGDDWRFEAEDVVGQTLVADDVCVHLSAFPHSRKEKRGRRSGI